MIKKRVNKIMAIALCTAVMAGLYAAPVMAKEIEKQGDKLYVHVEKTNPEVVSSISERTIINAGPGSWNMFSSCAGSDPNLPRHYYHNNIDASNGEIKMSTIRGGLGMDRIGSYFSLLHDGAVFQSSVNDSIIANNFTKISGSTITVTKDKDSTKITGNNITTKAIEADTYNGVALNNKNGKIAVGGINITDLKNDLATTNVSIAGIKRNGSETLIEEVLTVSKNGIGLKGDVVFDSKKHGSINLGSFYDEYRDNVGRYDAAIKALQDKTQNITADGNGTNINGNVNVNGNMGVGGDAGTNGGNIDANTGNIGGVEMANGNVSANNGIIGKVEMSDGNISANSGTIGKVEMANGNINAATGTIGGVSMANGNISANNITAANGSFNVVEGLGNTVVSGSVIQSTSTSGATGVLNGDRLTLGDMHGVYTELASGHMNVTGPNGSTTIDGGNVTTDKVTVGSTTIDKANGITSNKVTVGSTSVEDGKVTIGKTEVTDKDVVINKGADNEVSLSDIGNRIDNTEAGLADVNRRIDKVDGKVDKVGAGAAALAALHPLDYDAEDKLSFAAGTGNYGSETAAALGAFYRPNEKTMISMGSTLGNDENMVNLGISFSLNKTGKGKAAKAEMAAEIEDLRGQVSELTVLVNKLVAEVEAKNK